MIKSNDPIERKLDRLFGKKDDNSPSLLNWFLDWQDQQQNTMADPTYEAFTKTICALKKLYDEMTVRKVTFSMKTSVLSTLMVEFQYVCYIYFMFIIFSFYSFSIARMVTVTFTADQYTQNTAKYVIKYLQQNFYLLFRIGWDVFEYKSKKSRNYGLPKDNINSNHGCYGDLDIELQPLPLTK